MQYSYQVWSWEDENINVNAKHDQIWTLIKYCRSTPVCQTPPFPPTTTITTLPKSANDLRQFLILLQSYVPKMIIAKGFEWKVIRFCKILQNIENTFKKSKNY